MRLMTELITFFSLVLKASKSNVIKTRFLSETNKSRTLFREKKFN